jgi:CheY-like chemotaxis protein
MILFTHDHPGFADTVAAIIKQKGFPAKPATNGYKCFLAMLDHPPEHPLLVVLNYRIAGMNGVETLKYMRTDPAFAHTPVVILASDSELPRRREQAMSLGAMAWLPIGIMTDFVTVIEELTRLYERVGGVKRSQPT